MSIKLPQRILSNTPYWFLLAIVVLWSVAPIYFAISSSFKIPKEIFGYPNFIVDNSYLTGHDNINIFGKSEMKYFIKAGNTAIDFQLRK